MAKGENDYDVTFRPRFWDDPTYFHREMYDPFDYITFLHWDFTVWSNPALTDGYVEEIIKPWISRMERAVNVCNRTLHDDMVQLNELRRSERRFTKYSNLLKRHTVECDDVLLDIVRALRNLKHAWDKLYDKFENGVLKYYMLNNVLMSDIEHCFFLSPGSNQMNMMHMLNNKMKVFTNLHTELLKQSDKFQRKFLRQGMQAVRDKLDILQFFNQEILSEPTKEMIKMTERSLKLNDWTAVFDFLEVKQWQKSSSLRRKVLREVLLTSMDFLDLCLPDKGHLLVHIEVGTSLETLSTPSVCKTATKQD